MKRKNTLWLVCLFATLILMVGCGGSSEETKPAPTLPPDNSIAKPKLQMDMPASLVPSSQTAGAALTRAGTTLVNGATANACDFGEETDPFENGYAMTRFLVGISQAQTCFGDELIDLFTGDAKLFINLGKVGPLDPEPDSAATYFQIDRTSDASAETYTLRIFCDVAGTVECLYLTWSTTTAGDTSGQMIWLIPAAQQLPGDPNAMRVDFVRTNSTSPTTASNVSYFRFVMDATHQTEGFHVEAVQTGTGTSATYAIQGLISVLDQWDPNLLLLGLDFGMPALAMAAYADGTGLGASIAQLQNVGLHIENIDPTNSANDFNLGSYSYTVEDRQYFTAAGATEWQAKIVPPTNGAIRVNTDGWDNRTGVGLSVLLSCLESVAGCDFEPDGTVDIVGLGLTSGYFTEFCGDLDGSDCTAFIAGLYANGIMGATPNSDPTAEPGDFRQAALAVGPNLTSVWATTGLDASTTTFTIPAP